MVGMAELWLPILVSGIAVFFLSFIMWMIMPHHRSDWSELPDEEGVMKALGDVKAGQYMTPYCSSPEKMKDPDWIKKREAGPAAILLIFPRGPMKMGGAMGQSVVFNIVVAAITAYIATIGLGTAASGSDVFRLTATVTLLAYGAATVWDPIWKGGSWKTCWKNVADAVVYGLATGGLFALWWPYA